MVHGWLSILGNSRSTGDNVMCMYWVRQRRNHHRFDENVSLSSILSNERRSEKIKGKVDPISKKKTQKRWTQAPTNRNALPFFILIDVLNSRSEDKKKKKKKKKKERK
jgi:hypothetical protein